MSRSVATSTVVLILASIFELLLPAHLLAEVDPTKVMGIWLFDEIEGGKILDQSPNKNHGKLKGHTQLVRSLDTPDLDMAVDLDGQGGYVEVADDPSLNVTDAITVMAWVNIGGVGAGNAFFVVKQNPTNTPGLAYGLAYNPVDGNFFVGLDTEDSGFGPYYALQEFANVAEWVHFAFTYQAGPGELHAYVNGSEVDLGPPSQQGPDIPSGNIRTRHGRGPLRFGRQDAWPPGESANAFLDEVGIFNQALTEDDIVELMDGLGALVPLLCPADCEPTGDSELDCVDGVDNDCDCRVDNFDSDCCQPSEPEFELSCTDSVDNDCDGLKDCDDPDCQLESEDGATACRDGRDDDCDNLIDFEDPDCDAPPPVLEQSIRGMWLFDEEDGEIVLDSSGFESNGSFVGAPQYVEGRFGTGLFFDGAQDWVDVGVADHLRVTDLTVMAWVQFGGIGDGDGFIVSKQNFPGQGEFYYALQVNSGSRSFVGGLFVESTSRRFWTPVTAPHRTWAHFAMTYRSGELKHYVDGEEVTVTVTPQTKLPPKGPISGPAAGGPLQIGHQDAWNPPTFFFGILDEIAVFEGVLTQDQILDCMTNGLEECVFGGPPPEVCDDGQDNDQDGDADCNDTDCATHSTCGTGPFLRGDCDGNGSVGGSPTEAIVLLNFAFAGAEPPVCLAACDAEANGSLGVSDGLRILRYAFLGLGEPDPPFPDCTKSTQATDETLGCEQPTDCR